MTPLVELCDVRKVYNGWESVALDSVSLTIAAGQAAMACVATGRATTCARSATLRSMPSLRAALPKGLLIPRLFLPATFRRGVA